MTYRDTLTALERKASPLEKTLVHFLLVHPEKCVAIQEIVTPESFLNATAQKAYQEIVTAFLGDKFLQSHLREKGVKLTDFTAFDYHSPSNAERIAREIGDISVAYKLTDLLGRSIGEIEPSELGTFTSNFHEGFIKATQQRADEAYEITDILREYDKAQAEYTEKYQTGKQLIGLPTGFDKIDTIIDGLRPEHLWIIGGYTSSGKTFLALNLAASLIRQGKRVVFYSLEMSKIDIVSRLIGILAGMSGHKAFKGTLTDDERERVMEARELMKKSGLRIRGNKHELGELALSMIEENMRAHVDCYLLDFLQLVTVRDARSEYESMSKAAKIFQDTAKRLKAPMILLSQVSNEGAKNPNSVVLGFKGAGDIAAAADLAIQLNSGEDSQTEYFEKLDAGQPVKITCAIKKNRHGRTGNIALLFDSVTGRFTQNEYDF